MSAFICNDYHISSIVQAGINYKAWANLGNGFAYITSDQAQNVFEILQRENVRSVNARYKENTSGATENLGTHRFIMDVTALGTLKAIACLEYQSCEHEQWTGSLAEKLLQSIKEASIRRLPGYEDAAWEISEPKNYVAPISLFELSKKLNKKKE